MTQEPITIRFNVAETTKYGNGGGSKVVLICSTEANEIRSALAGKIDLHFGSPNVDFPHGEYEVTIAKIEHSVGLPYKEEDDDFSWLIH